MVNPVWQADCKHLGMTATETSIAFSSDVQRELCQLAFDTFTSKPGEGQTLSGVLTGKDRVVTGIRAGLEDVAGGIGYWSVRRKAETHWAEAPGAGIYVVVVPVTVQRAEAMVWQRDAAGKETAARSMVFQVERRAANRERRSTETKPEVVAMPPRQEIDWRWAWMAAPALLLGLLIWVWPGIAEADATPPPRLAMGVRDKGGDLRVTWRESGEGAAARLESAALLIREGQREETIDLGDAYEPEGGLTLQTDAWEVVVSLRVRRAGRPVAMQTVTYVKPALAKRGGELEELRLRNRELEERLAELGLRL